MNTIVFIRYPKAKVITCFENEHDYNRESYLDRNRNITENMWHIHADIITNVAAALNSIFMNSQHPGANIHSWNHSPNLT